MSDSRNRVYKRITLDVDCVVIHNGMEIPCVVKLRDASESGILLEFPNIQFMEKIRKGDELLITFLDRFIYSDVEKMAVVKIVAQVVRFEGCMIGATCLHDNEYQKYISDKKVSEFLKALGG